VLNQLANLITIFQNEIMGAVAFSSVDTLLAPFIKADKLTYKEVRQSMQNFIYSINSNSRGGAEPAFSNITLDLFPPSDLKDKHVCIGGEVLDMKYGDCQSEMDMFNKAFVEIMLEGDAVGRPFAYPIPTYNIHEGFDWDNPNNDGLFEMAGKYGYPYFANYINSDMNPEDARSMCCRLRLDLTELRKRNGGLFGSGDSTGSIGVVTVNLPRIAYLAETNIDYFFKLLDEQLEFAKDSLEIKRQFLQEEIFGRGALPAFKTYVGTLDNHFSTIGIVGMNEMCVNLLRLEITDESGKAFAMEVSNHIRSKLVEFQRETGHLYNYEATPAESTAFRLALKDKNDFPDIYTQGTQTSPYYTNSCHLPVSDVETINDTLAHQDTLQTQFTGGTVVHLYMKGAINKEQAKHIIKTSCETYSLPYISISPINRYCKVHGYIDDLQDTCPACGAQLDLYQRITGYIRKVEFFNDGKKAEYYDRNQYPTN
jgi:ribonucleoside-triphosphate reductase